MYVILTEKRLILTFCITATVLILTGQFFSVKSSTQELSTNAERVQYISTLGVTLQNDNYERKDVVIPYEFGDVYENYNSLQIKSGFNLKAYCGKVVTVYTYFTDDEKSVHLMIYKNKLIGGDISETRVNGEMLPLERT